MRSADEMIAYYKKTDDMRSIEDGLDEKTGKDGAMTRNWKSGVPPQISGDDLFL